MRTDKELLQLVLRVHQKSRVVFKNNAERWLQITTDLGQVRRYKGLCLLIIGMSQLSVIGVDEAYRLLDILDDELPDTNDYTWKPGYKKPRIEFLKQLIEQYEN